MNICVFPFKYFSLSRYVREKNIISSYCNQTQKQSDLLHNVTTWTSTKGEIVKPRQWDM